MWAHIAVAVVLLVASYLITNALTPGPPKKDPAAIDDFDFPSAEEGTPQSVVFGDVWSGDWMVLWFGDFEVQPVKAKGGKK